ncbi:MAG: pilus assembly protein [Mesorhizobium sp.]|nr:MAG: pilus assembly protein [Mesorhizobium sp.]
MIRKFGRDRRGNYTLMTVITMVPLMGGLALSVDYSELLRQKSATLNALDGARLATAAGQRGAKDRDRTALFWAAAFFGC